MCADSWKFNRAAYHTQNLEVGFGAFKMGGSEASYTDVCIGPSCKGAAPKRVPLAVPPTVPQSEKAAATCTTVSDCSLAGDCKAGKCDCDAVMKRHFDYERKFTEL